MGVQPFSVGTRTQLFVDDFLIASARGLQTRLHAVAKHPRPVLTPSAPWERPGTGGLWGPLNVQHDGATGQFQLWYTAYGTYPARGRAEDPAHACLVRSRDGLAWERPALGLIPFEGSSANNLLVADGLGHHGVGRGPRPGHGMIDSASFAPDEPPDVRFKSAEWLGRDAAGWGTHGVCFSPDGLRWRYYEDNPVIRGRNLGDVISSVALYDLFAPDARPAHPASRYALFPKVHIELGPWRRRCVAVCTSDDSAAIPFTAWSEETHILSPDARDDAMAEERLARARPILQWDHPDDHRCEFYGVQVFRCGDVFLGLLWVFDAAMEFSRVGSNNQYAIVEVQLVTSRDLIHWERAGDRQPVIPRGPADAFDSHMIFYHSLPLPIGDEWWIYYMGFNEGHAARMGYTEELRARYWAEVRAGRRHFPSVGLGRVRQEGFISRRGGLAGGTMLTRSLQPGGGRLEVNADCGRGGEVRVEVQDLAGRPLVGFATSDCQPLAGDNVRHAVRWGERAGDASWASQPLRLKFTIRD
ncbi:MAG: hypothetical protein FJ029_05295, partial [Actinobacteria bacterium]|nr:hypothetical protein [Actinomycetota bacterium]